MSHARTSNLKREVLTDNAVENYLRSHADFIEHHANLLETLKVPHSRSKAVSLVERQAGCAARAQSPGSAQVGWPSVGRARQRGAEHAFVSPGTGSTRGRAPETRDRDHQGFVAQRVSLDVGDD